MQWNFAIQFLTTSCLKSKIISYVRRVFHMKKFIFTNALERTEFLFIDIICSMSKFANLTA